MKDKKFRQFRLRSAQTNYIQCIPFGEHTGEDGVVASFLYKGNWFVVLIGVIRK